MKTMTKTKPSRRRGRKEPLALTRDERRLLFWHVAGVGAMARDEIEFWLASLGLKRGGPIRPPPIYGSDLPFGDVPDLSPEAEDLGISLLAEALFKTLRDSGQLRAVEEKRGEMEQAVKAAREIIRSSRMSEDHGSEQISV